MAAKGTYLVLVVLRAEVALNGPAALAGLVKDEARWFYPLTHLLAACGAGLFVALATCAVFGLLFRMIHPSRVRSAALWVQIAVVTVPLLGRPIRRALAVLPPVPLELHWWSAVPFTWFNILAVAGQARPAVPLDWTAGLLGVAGSALVIGSGIRSLSAGYMRRITGVLRSSRRGVQWHRKSSVGGRLVRLLTGRPSGEAAYGFLHPMMRRDWHFRRAAVQFGVLILVGIPAILRSGRAVSPFDANRMPLVGLLPELLPFLTLVVCTQLAFSQHHRGAWIFSMAPAGARHGFVRGIYWALWLPFLFVPFAALLVFFSPSWGLFNAALFAGYGLAVASLLLAAQLLFVDGLPFGRPPQAERPYVLLPLIIFGPIVLGVAWFLQGQLIFRHRWVTLLAAAAAAGLATVVARVSLRILDVRVRRDLDLLGGGPAGMFVHSTD